MRHGLLIGVGLTGMATCLTGCGSGTSASAVFRYRVFEIAPEHVDAQIMKYQPTASSESKTWTAPVSSQQIERMTRYVDDKPGVLTDKGRLIFNWPSVADTWSYALADATGEATVAGGGAGTLGVRRRFGKIEARIEYSIGHTTGAGHQLEARIVHEGPIPEEGGIAFLSPIRRGDRELYLVVAFVMSPRYSP